MTLVVATRVLDDARLEIDAASAVITGNSSSLSVTYREALFAFLLVAHAPKILLYTTIAAQILHPAGIALPPSDPMPYIRKLKLQVDKDFERAAGEEELIGTKRGAGYQLTGLPGEWEITFPRSHGELDAAFTQLRKLAMECIPLMRRTPVVKAEDGSLILDPKANKMQVIDLAQRFESAASLFVDAVQSDPRLPSAEAYQPHLEDIYSYFTFRRRGHVEEHAWRHLFERELLRKLDFLQSGLS